MKNSLSLKLFLSIVLLVSAATFAYAGRGDDYHYTVSMDDPSNHYFRVEFRMKGISSDTVVLKMPAWTPGYYMILDLARNVVEFQASDASGHPLPFGKTAKNGWRIETKGIGEMMVTYFVFANRVSVADPYLAENRGFISPTGLFMYVDGHKDHPVTVTVNPFRGWKTVSTGLDPVSGEANSFTAADFDILYDCPILVGNQEVVKFDFKGVPHEIAIENPGDCDRKQLVADLKRIIEAGTSILGEIPYRHYTFLVMDKGPGGLEHLNSMAVFADLTQYTGGERDRGIQGFLAHEYFHLFNVKRIRPIVLGPFDYDRECITNMLWFSEGGTVYYQNLILNRAGFLPRGAFLEDAGKNIGSHENIMGHQFQSAALSSRDTWMLFFNRNENSRDVTINYYNKGATLCLLLDLRIRHESGNRRSLDDVMRSLYQVYYKSLKRGFTDKEFQKSCEEMAGCPLDDFFNYIYTTNEIDYARYLGYAGLNIDLAPQGEAVHYLDKTLYKKPFTISPSANPDEGQKKMLELWLK